MRDDFLKIEAHELKTPLTVQKAAVQSLDRQVVSRPVCRAPLHDVAQAGPRLGSPRPAMRGVRRARYRRRE